MSKPMSAIPGPEPINNLFKVLATFRAFNRDALGVLDQQKQQYGDVVALEILGEKQLLIANSELFREVLVTKAKAFHKGADYKDTRKGLARFLGNGLIVSDGEFWQKQRKRVQPAFHAKRIEDYGATMGIFAEEMVRKWQNDTVLDIAHEMTQVTLRIVARTIFNTDVQHNADNIATTMEAINETAGQNTILPAWVPTPQELQARKAIRDMDAYVYDLIRTRRRDLQDTGDLLSMLLLAEDDEGNHMSDQEVRDEAVGLFLAGHETTANALNWTLWLLAQNPQAEARLHDELDQVLGGRTPTVQDLRNLPYTTWVIKEAMRWMPPVSGVGRRAIEDVQIGDYLIEAGTAVLLNFYSIHRDPRYWDDPLAFRPERFAPEAETERDRYAYLPFGGGARICVGNSFAMMEAQILLATIAQHAQLSLQEGQTVQPVSRITTYPKDGLPMRVSLRDTQRILEHV